MDTQPTNSEYYSIDNAAWELDLSTARIRGLMKAGTLESVVVDGKTHVTVASVEAERVRRETGRTEVKLTLPAEPKRKRITVPPPPKTATYRPSLPPPNKFDDAGYVPDGQPYVIYIPPTLLREVNEFLNERGVLTQNAFRYSKRRAWAWQQAYRAYERENKPFDPTDFFARTAGSTPEKWYSIEDPDKPLLELVEYDDQDEKEAAITAQELAVAAQDAKKEKNDEDTGD